ncbi:MAG: aminotransferase class V-fold PLP-dependent enzyme, partial [Chloroflexota bacterium]
ALELAYAEFDERHAHYNHLREMLTAGICSRVPGAQTTGHPDNRLPSHASFVFPELDANMLVMHLDLKGIAASSASACKVGNPEPSGVLLALGYDRDTAMGSLRLTVGTQTTEDDVNYVLDTLAEIVPVVQRISAF